MQELCCQLTVRHHSGPDFHERVSRNAGEEMAEKIMTYLDEQGMLTWYTKPIYQRAHLV